MIHLNGEYLAKHGKVNFDFTLQKGAILGAVGPNGVGKSTFVNFLKLEKQRLFPNNSVLFLDQFPLTPLPHLTGNDLFNLLDESYKHLKVYSSSKDFELIDEFGLRSKLDTPIVQLSGGENQLLKISMIFYLKADIYVLDEPSHYLDMTKLAYLKNYILNLKQNNSTYLFIIDHRYKFLSELTSSFVQFYAKEKSTLIRPATLDQVLLLSREMV